jgi:Tol biopolymer transport system component
MILAVVKPDGKFVRLHTETDMLLGSPVWAPDGTMIYFTRYYEGGREKQAGVEGLWAVDTSGTGQPQRILEGRFSHLHFSPDGKRFAYLDWSQRNQNECRILVADKDGSNERPVAIGGDCLGWLSDNTSLLFVRHNEAQKGVWSVMV